MLHKYFDRVYGLYLDSRLANYDRINYIIPHEKFICGKGLDSNVQYDHVDVEYGPPIFPNSIQYQTWYVRNNAYNAWLCHKKIFERFYNDPAIPDTILLLEDDIEFMEDYENIVNLIEEKIVGRNWDMLYFGCYQNGKSEPTNHPNIRVMNGGGGFHCVAMKRHIVEELLSYRALGPYDYLAGKYLHNKYKCLAVYPTVVNQSDGYSSVEGHNLTKPSFWQV